MRIRSGIIMLFLCVPAAARADDAQGHAYDGTIRMHASPFAPDTHAPTEEKKPVAPSISRRGFGPATATAPLATEIRPSMPLPPPPDRTMDTETRRKENWITPSSPAAEQTEAPAESGWGWLADQTARKLAEQQRIREEPADQKEDSGRAAPAQKEDRQTVRDPTFFMSSDYFNNAGMFDTAAQFNTPTEEGEPDTAQPGGSDMIKAAVDHLDVATGSTARQDETEELQDEQRGTDRKLTSRPDSIGIQAGSDKRPDAGYSRSPEVIAPRQSLPPVAFSPSSFEATVTPSAVRIPAPAAGGAAGFSRIAAPSAPTAPAGITRPTGFSGSDSPLTRPSLMPAHGAAPVSSAGMPPAGNIQTPVARPAAKSLYDAREESGMRLLPQ